MPTCDTTAERARIPQKGFYEIGKTILKDSEFTPGSSSLYWANMNELDGKMAIIEAT